MSTQRTETDAEVVARLVDQIRSARDVCGNVWGDARARAAGVAVRRLVEEHGPDVAAAAVDRLLRYPRMDNPANLLSNVAADMLEAARQRTERAARKQEQLDKATRKESGR